jgi:hypothetical protein
VERRKIAGGQDPGQGQRRLERGEGGRVSTVADVRAMPGVQVQRAACYRPTSPPHRARAARQRQAVAVFSDGCLSPAPRGVPDSCVHCRPGPRRAQAKCDVEWRPRARAPGFFFPSDLPFLSAHPVALGSTTRDGPRPGAGASYARRFAAPLATCGALHSSHRKARLAIRSEGPDQTQTHHLHCRWFSKAARLIDRRACVPLVRVTPLKLTSSIRD